MTALMPEYDTTDSIPVFAPREPVRLPRVNLLPPEIIEKRAVARLGQRLAGVVLIAALIGAAVGYEAGAGHDSAQQRLDAAQTQGSRLQAERARLAPAQQALTAAQQAQQTLKAAMAQEVLWSLPGGGQAQAAQDHPAVEHGAGLVDGSNRQREQRVRDRAEDRDVGDDGFHGRQRRHRLDGRYRGDAGCRRRSGSDSR